ncbi:orotidine-5'-phosphate decarboxylase [Spiribacter sp. 2438]|uniref:orotidine-5'-phosphate decarboxylase n=1 Tax=Spiribacter sp. 2438 TaxID=2666185 RepID=UPI0012AF71EC|nr:orotidine-5'-phosphate decarboxylase [Spiribacter sp. 2438]QGM21406.1 orotidine-5'-phosphate decarboxylase [Spiribacter sp. 2438]
MAKQPVIVALDLASVSAARSLVERLEPGSCRLKVGKELFVRGGPSLVDEWVRSGWDVFLDLKFHDIPNTVAAACRAAADLGVWMVNVHALGGARMLEAARRGLDDGNHRPLLTAVTLLTSHDEQSLTEVGLRAPMPRAVDRLAELASDCGLDGVVCSAHEAGALREAFGEPFRRVTPGIRPTGVDAGDQTRVMTPRRALEAGATDLVIGRPITAAADPVTALAAINAEIGFTPPS